MVKEPDRSHGKLEVNTKAKAFCKHTLQITANKNVFFEGNEEVLEEIRRDAIRIHRYCWIANNIKVENDMERYKKRIGLEQSAIDLCVDMGALIDLSKSLWHLSGKKVKYWNGLLEELKTMISSWRSSDIKRLKPRP